MKNTERKNNRAVKLLKKGASITLCAALAGTVAAGAFEGVNALTGWNQGLTVKAAEGNEDQSLLLTSESESSESDEGSSSAGKGRLDVSDIVKEAMPSVVSITTKTIEEVQDYFYGFFNYGNYNYAPQQREVEGSGSGIIVGKNEEQLLIATNYHVIKGAETLTVSFIDGSSYEAQARGSDEYRDLAVVAVPLADISEDTMNQISVATIGSSDDLLVGEQVVAIGNALGYGQSVTTGIVSAKNRRLNGSSSDTGSNSKDVNLIQTDAAINPGNSGGALLNMNGEVVGINSSKLASTEVEGMCYAIAISDVADILQNLMNETPREKIEDGNHGVLEITGRTVSSDVSVYGIPQGVFVEEVTEGGAADQAGIKKRSIITEFDNKVVTSIEDLVNLLEYYEPKEKVDVVVASPDGEGAYQERTVTVTLGENPDAGKNTADNSDKNLGKDQNDDSQNSDGSESGNGNNDGGSGNEGSGNSNNGKNGQSDFFDDWAEKEGSDAFGNFFW